MPHTEPYMVKCIKAWPVHEDGDFKEGNTYDAFAIGSGKGIYYRIGKHRDWLHHVTQQQYEEYFEKVT